ncbi:MAG: acylneuraminate cytidylyltransferase family protein [Endomicrobium sp.]|jgi:CMP-N-acetylneuraminic acid synthetase|nr:acylneuraminate cytidylyltransferase family protein [Endomicrobium sp.]
MKIKALIPVRKGSSRIINKNIRPFAGSSLLEIKIQQLKRIKMIEGIVVNSDSIEMLSLAQFMGCEIVKRDAFFATTDVSANDFFENIAKPFPCDIIVMTPVTNPLLKDETIKNCINKFFELREEGYDSLNTVHEFKEYLLLDGKPMNFNVEKWVSSQFLPNTQIYNNAINIISRETVLRIRNVIGFNPYFFNIDPYEAIDINNPIDFDIAEELYKRLIK